MIVYQIYKGENVDCQDIFEMQEYVGLSDELTAKLNAGKSLYSKPWKECVPFFLDNRFVFVNMNTLEHFLYNQCKLTHEDIMDLSDNGYNVLKIHVDCYTSGLSKTIATIDTEEVEEFEFISWAKVCDDYYVPGSNSVTKKFQTDCFNQYYNGKDVGRYEEFLSISK